MERRKDHKKRQGQSVILADNTNKQKALWDTSVVLTIATTKGTVCFIGLLQSKALPSHTGLIKQGDRSALGYRFSYGVGGCLFYTHDCNRHMRIKIAVLHIFISIVWSWNPGGQMWVVISFFSPKSNGFETVMNTRINSSGLAQRYE